MKYRITRWFASTNYSFYMTMPTHEDAWKWGQGLLQSNREAIEATYTEFSDNKLIVRVMSTEKLLAKIESI